MPAQGPAGSAGSAHPAVGRAMRLLEADLARQWTLLDLATNCT